MFVVMKDGKYFTGDVTEAASAEVIRWTRHPAGAKVGCFCITPRKGALVCYSLTESRLINM